MRKTHMGLCIAMTCLFVVAVTVLGSATASAHTVQSSKKFHHWSAQKPHIIVKMFSNAGRHGKHSNVERATIYGVGFNLCDCGNNAPSYSSAPSYNSSPSYNNCPSDCGDNAPSYSNGPSYNSSPSYNNCPSDCGNSAPGYSSAPGYNSVPDYNDCGCNTANLQSSVPISASTSGVNLSQVPVNAFGEFQVVVNVHQVTRHHSTPTVWAINSYNDQPSNHAPMCTCN